MIIVGLWNSYDEFDNTVHNIGQMVLKAILKDLETTFLHCVFKKKYSEYRDKYKIYTYILKNKIILNFLLLEGYINLSGQNLKYAGEEIDNLIENNELVTIYDDIGLKTGVVLVSYGKGSNHHNGVKGIDKTITDKHWRIRVGITKELEYTNRDFVISKINKKHKINNIIFSLSFCFLNSVTNNKTNNEKLIMNSVQTNVNTEFK